MSIILKLLINTIAVSIVAQSIPGIHLADFSTAFIVAFVFGLINIIIKPIISFIALPVTLITFGLFSLVINAFLFWFASQLVNGFTVEGFIPAFVGSIIVSLIVWIGESLLGLE